MVHKLHSIKNIHKYFGTTGSKPVGVLCDDGNIYVCKYDRRRGDDPRLNEYLGTCLLQCCGIPTPNMAWVQIGIEHNPDKNAVEDIFLNDICFGSLYLPNTADFHEILEDRNITDLKYINRIDVLKIALFDLWASHQDRNQENTNLLVGVYENSAKERIIAIDNASIFNFEFGERNSLKPLQYEQSMLSSVHLKVLYADEESVFFDAEIAVKLWQNGVQNCIKIIDNILAELHISLDTDTELLKEWIVEKLCAENHLKAVEKQFYEYLSQTFSK
jgi:hypothetical protein